MRDTQQQLNDLQDVVIKGLRDIKRKRLIRYAYPIVLEGEEGVIIRNLMELIATGDRNISSAFAGSAFFEKSVVFCSNEFYNLKETEL